MRHRQSWWFEQLTKSLAYSILELAQIVLSFLTNVVGFLVHDELWKAPPYPWGRTGWRRLQWCQHNCNVRAWLPRNLLRRLPALQNFFCFQNVRNGQKRKASSWTWKASWTVLYRQVQEGFWPHDQPFPDHYSLLVCRSSFVTFLTISILGFLASWPLRYVHSRSLHSQLQFSVQVFISIWENTCMILHFLLQHHFIESQILLIFFFIGNSFNTFWLDLLSAMESQSCGVFHTAWTLLILLRSVLSKPVPTSKPESVSSLMKDRQRCFAHTQLPVYQPHHAEVRDLVQHERNPAVKRRNVSILQERGALFSAVDHKMTLKGRGHLIYIVDQLWPVE